MNESKLRQRRFEMPSPFESACSLYEELKKAFKAENYQQCKMLLTSMKVEVGIVLSFHDTRLR